MCFSEFVFSLEASDNFLKDRVQNLPESLVEKMRYRRDEFLRRLEKYREMNVEDETVLNYFDELEIHPEHLGNDWFRVEFRLEFSEKMFLDALKPG